MFGFYKPVAEHLTVISFILNMSVFFEEINDRGDLICECCGFKSNSMFKIITYSHVSPNDPKIFCEQCKKHPGYMPCPLLKKSSIQEAVGGAWSEAFVVKSEPLYGKTQIWK